METQCAGAYTRDDRHLAEAPKRSKGTKFMDVPALVVLPPLAVLASAAITLHADGGRVGAGFMGLFA